MNKEFVPYEIALALKELGFNETCFGYWNRDTYLPKLTFNLVKPFAHEWCVPAPLYSQAFRFFREKYRLHQEISIGVRGFYYTYRNFYDSSGVHLFDVHPFTGQLMYFETYETAELACLIKLIEIVKNN